MSWRRIDVLDERVAFMAQYLSHQLSMADLCRAFQVSRKTGYKFVRRYQALGPVGLHDLSRAPHHQPYAVDESRQELIIALRAAHPTWGPKKLQPELVRLYPDIPWPTVSTVGAILERHGLVRSSNRRRRPAHPTPSPLTAADGPNLVWPADFKGEFRLRNGRLCYPFTISDAYSRMLMRCQALYRTTFQAVYPLCVATFHEYGLPQVIRTDNGPPFVGRGFTGLSCLSVWWIKLGIRPEPIQPGRPHQNGRHERMHRTLKQEATIPPQHTLAAQQRTFDRFRDEYNHIRPHEALGQKPPATLYTPSPRPYPLRLPAIEYPAGMTVRRVRHDGCIRWRGEMLFISETLVGEPVALDPLDDRYWALYFGPVPLAIFDPHKTAWLPPKPAAPILKQLRQELNT